MGMVAYESDKVPRPTPEEEAMMLAHAHEEPDLSDAPELTEEAFARATRPYLEAMRVDSEVLEWLTTQRKGYANSILRDAMLRETQKASQSTAHIYS